ncbi:phosphoribosylglycinamide formyltransferase [Sandaracinobacteroides hominis]|uniref:phosphoribosylglycinamide formyltransferase n=1 Tax=Sandaracinobacteroides hominis TaxID=2780086 RepID=UPI0018F6522B|nr:phosphoribosylglycinamide formyltransferase [Sandaracinobacteroides hominis]
MRKARLAVLISGRGSNMLSLAKAAQQPDYPAELMLVASNKADAGGLETAAGMGIETLALSHRTFPSREAFDEALSAELKARQIEVVALAGFMRILTPGFMRDWEGRIVNIHPSLLPKYPGLHTHERAIEAGDAEAGCTVHVVTELLDDGPMLAQARVPVLPGDTPDTLAARVLAQEHRIYPEALAAHVRNMVAKGLAGAVKAG